MRPRQRSLNVFGEHLGKLLAGRKMTETELCRQTGTKPSTFSHYKSRPPAFAPSPELAERWAKALGLDAAGTTQLVMLFQLAYAPEHIQQAMRDQLTPAKSRRR